jgi:hypothetical protein
LRTSRATTTDDRRDVLIVFTVAARAVDVTQNTSSIRFFVRRAPTRIHSPDARNARSSRIDSASPAARAAASPARPSKLRRRQIMLKYLIKSNRYMIEYRASPRTAGLLGAIGHPLPMPRRTLDRYKHTYRDPRAPTPLFVTVETLIERVSRRLRRRQSTRFAPLTMALPRQQV